MKVLKILNSENLPLSPSRDDNYIYFCYDNLEMYNGKIHYTDPYCIVEDFPVIADNPVPNIFYIRISDGNLCIYLGDIHEWFLHAEIESADQLEYLTKAGTTFLMKSGYRYIDQQTKALNLPFENGSYQLSVNIENPIKINESTIIVYNPETDRFEIDGERYYDEFGRNPEIMKYTGVETNTAITTIANDHISADVKISSAAGNMVQSTATGLYVPANSYATLTDFQQLVTRCRNQADTYAASLATIQESLAHMDVTLTDETLKEKIDETVRKYFPNIASIIRSYDDLYSMIGNVVGDLTAEIDSQFDDAEFEIIQELETLKNIGGWCYFIDTFEANIDNVAANRYTINVDFIIEPGYGLFYKPTMTYLYTDQDISGLGFTQFTNGATLYMPEGDIATLCYAKIEGSTILAQSCHYFELNIIPPVVLINVDSSTMPISIADCNNWWTWLDPNFLYKPGTFCYHSAIEHRLYFYVAASDTLDMHDTAPNSSNFDNYDYTNNQIVLRFQHSTNPNSGYYLAGIQLDPSETRITGTFYGNTSGIAYEYLYGDTRKTMVYVSKPLHVASGGTIDREKIIFASAE